MAAVAVMTTTTNINPSKNHLSTFKHSNSNLIVYNLNNKSKKVTLSNATNSSNHLSSSLEDLEESDNNEKKSTSTDTN